MKCVCVNSVSTWKTLMKDIATYLTFTLHDQMHVYIIRRKLRHLADVYRHFKMFIFLKSGVLYNLYSNTTKVDPKYWKNIAHVCYFNWVICINTCLYYYIITYTYCRSLSMMHISEFMVFGSMKSVVGFLITVNWTSFLHTLTRMYTVLYQLVFISRVQIFSIT